MGALRLISSLLVNRRRNWRRRLADHNHGRTQQATIELIALLEHLQNAVRFDVGAFLHGHRLMVNGVEWFAMRIDRFKLITLERVMEHFQGQLDTFAHRADAFVVRARQLEAALQAVDDRQQVTGEFFQRKLVRLLDILLGTAADVLQIGSYAQD